jgi:GMP synthase-like glutamine amidotransferase
MNINILIVDGNEQKDSEIYTSNGIKTQYEEYSDALNYLSSSKLNIQVIHPAVNEDFIPPNINLEDFQGIVWTGSTLNIYDQTPPIVRQIELAKLLLSKNNIIFGSCWGLQVFTTAAGGVVAQNTKGLEAVISRNITLNIKGLSHPMYLNKPKKFDAFCWHYDEIKTIPNNATILAFNEHCSVQALTFKKEESEFWGVQYHPEFTPKWMLGLMKIRKDILLDNKIFINSDEFNNMTQALLTISENKSLSSDIHINNSIIDRNIHFLELGNWLKNLENFI